MIDLQKGQRVTMEYEKDVVRFVEGIKNGWLPVNPDWVYHGKSDSIGMCFVQPGTYGETYLYAKESSSTDGKIVTVKGEVCLVPDKRGQRRRNSEILCLLKDAGFEVSPVLTI